MRLLVTGASGFVGAHVCRALAASGHDVRTDADAHASALDLADEGVADAIVGETDPDAIVHLAARVEPRNHAWHALLRNNQLAALRVLEAVRRRAPRARVLIASSSA